MFFQNEEAQKMSENLKQKPKCEYCNDTGLDPKSYDEHIRSQDFWFANPCLIVKRGEDGRK